MAGIRVDVSLPSLANLFSFALITTVLMVSSTILIFFARILTPCSTTPTTPYLDVDYCDFCKYDNEFRPDDQKRPMRRCATCWWVSCSTCDINNVHKCQRNPEYHDKNHDWGDYSLPKQQPRLRSKLEPT